MPEQMKTVERRITTIGSEIRVTKGDSPKITGHAAVFNALSDDLGGFREKIKRGAFRESLQNGDDVRALVDHDPSRILGRMSAGTLKVREDRHGLLVEIDPPDTQAGRDIMTSIERGDVTGMSFGFQTIEDEWNTVDGADVRTLKQVRLIDVSPVTFPAYPDTDVSLSVAQRSHEAWKESNNTVTFGTNSGKVTFDKDEIVLDAGGEERSAETPTSVLRAKLDLAEAE